MPDTLNQSVRNIDLSGRLGITTAIVGSPAAAAETIVAQATIPSGLTLVSGVIVMGWLAYTLGATAASSQVRIRQTGLAGTIIANSGAQTGGHSTAGQLVSDDVNGFDTAPPTPGVYVLTLQVAAGSGASTVSAAWLVLLAV